MNKDKTHNKPPELKGFEEIELEGFEDLELDGIGDIELEPFDVTLEAFLLVSDKDLEKIVGDIQELGDITQVEPMEVVKQLRQKWKTEGG